MLSTSSGITHYCQENIPVNDTLLFYLARVWNVLKSLLYIKFHFTTLFAEGSYAMEIPSNSGELSLSLLWEVCNSPRPMHSRVLQALGSVCSLSSHNFWISTVQYFQTHPSTFFVFYIFYVAYFIATPTLGLLNTITLQWLLLGEVATWTATEFPYCWCRSVSSPRSVACWMDASGAILPPHLHPSRQLHLFKLQREPPYAVTGIETLGIRHKLTTMSKSFKWKYPVGTRSCCTSLHLFDKATLFMWLTCPCNKRGISCEVPEIH